MIIYIINGCVTIKNINDRSHHGYFMVYVATKGVVLYCNPYQPFYIHISHNYWSVEYNSCLSIEDKNTPGSLFLKQDHEIICHNQDLINLIPCEIDATSTPFLMQ